MASEVPRSAAAPWRTPRRLASLRWRITLGATAIVLFALLIVSLAVAGLLRRSLDRNTDELLSERIDAVAALIDAGELNPILDSTGREIGQVQVIDADGVVVSNTSGLAATTRFDVVPSPRVGEKVVATVNGASIDNDPGEMYRLVSSTVTTQDGAFSVFAVTSLDTSEAAQGYLTSRLLWSLPLIGLVTGAVIYGVVGRALTPVERMRRRVEEMSATDRTARLDLGRHDDELTRLGSTMNGFLERLDASAAQQRLFAANASHELRSPLSAMRTDLEVGLAYPERTDWTRTANDALIEIERLERLSRDLRSLTKAADSARFEVVDVVELVRNEIERRNAIDIEFRTSNPSVHVAIDRDGLVQVVRNLLDNAERHATSSIRVSVLVAPGSEVEIRIANDGPSIRTHDRDTIFEPFTRLDEARSLDSGGSGLGLAIVRAVLSANDATIDAVDREQGAEFRVVLPRVQQGDESAHGPAEASPPRSPIAGS